MADTEKLKTPKVKKQMPAPGTSEAGPLGLGAGLESPRSPHC
jgi:hypothetical protein